MTAVFDGLPAPAAARGNRRWWALGALCLAGLAVGVDGTVLSVALPTLSRALHASESDLQWFFPPSRCCSARRSGLRRVMWVDLCLGEARD